MTAPTFLYNLKSNGPAFVMAKLDADLNIAAVYNLAPKGFSFTCDCPANNRTVNLKPCKHKRMLPFMLGAVNTDRFYDPDTRTWHQPLTVAGEAGLPASEDESDVVGEAPSATSEPESYGTMSPERRELLEVGREANERMQAKIAAHNAAQPAP